MRVYYFGCWRIVGHYFWKPGYGGPVKIGRQSLRGPGDLPWVGQVDNKLNPSSVQSEAAIHHRMGWTALAMADYTVDSRRGSNSVFLFHGTLDFDAAVDAAREHFPKVIWRIEEHTPIFDTADPGGSGRG